MITKINPLNTNNFNSKPNYKNTKCKYSNFDAKNNVSFGAINPISLISVAASLKKHSVNLWGAHKIHDLVLGINRVADNPHIYSQGKVLDTLVALTKLRNSADDGFGSVIMSLFNSEAPWLRFVRRKVAASHDFMDALNDNSIVQKQAKRDFFRDFVNNAYAFSERSNINESRVYKVDGAVVDLTVLSDSHYRDLKEEIGDTLLNSRIYSEKYEKEGSNFHNYLNNLDTCNIISRFDKNTYRSFLKRNKEAYIAKLEDTARHC